MTETPAAPTLTPDEEEQIRQTIEMFEVITQANPRDTQSMEILKEAYAKLGRESESLAVSRRLGDTYMELSQFSSALLEYEGILQRQPDNGEVIAALGEVEQRLQQLQAESQGSADSINLDFRTATLDTGNLIATKQTQSLRLQTSGFSGDTKELAAKLAVADDGQEALMKFLSQHRLVSEDILLQALHLVRRRNAERAAGQIAASLIDEIVTRGAVDQDQLLSGILDRVKFAYIPLDCYDVDRQVVKMLPDEITLGRLFVPFDVISRTMMIAVANPFDSAGKEAVQQLVDYHIQWHLASPDAIIKLLQSAYR
jgi:tetratricopeptide (TPR) repeat protein